ncbi:uncharacterized protein [Palaemon carinicauda]|uniref:uncharacterized protein n=1 Tax=Palaemon carinicauda TaxID=392227 RepID=UPI0035B62F21
MTCANHDAGPRDVYTTCHSPFLYDYHYIKLTVCFYDEKHIYLVMLTSGNNPLGVKCIEHDGPLKQPTGAAPLQASGTPLLWELSIREVKLKDAGLYECQLATYPFTSYFFTLKVVEARAVIHGGPEVHIHTGNQLRLHCSVQQATEPPVFIFWFHNNSMVNYEAKRPLEVIVSHHYSSTLVINNVTWCDAGSYTCEPYNAVPSNVTVHVVEGEKQAALYKGEKESGSTDGDTASSSSPSFPINRHLSVVMQLFITAYSSY